MAWGLQPRIRAARRIRGPVEEGIARKETRWLREPERERLRRGRECLRRRPGNGLRRDPGLAVGDLENLKSRPRQRRARDPNNGPYKYTEAGGDREPEEARPGGFPDTQIRERTPQSRRVAAV
ncbi:hypothetical protein NDU88_002476 [Pleurodeles waltl]|uniref:Uncharacterized protein n=1 Tax=Pleurodeles waltl TaxID=8319 RepID=A0AAV7P9H6_PLEWA|nr:hypothetical protein NDU88_002476 [Pleurodeles waltl]